MNWEQLETEWSDRQGEIRKRWPKLTPADLSAIGGKRDAFVRRVGEHYPGRDASLVEGDVDAFLEGLEPAGDPQRPEGRPTNANRAQDVGPHGGEARGSEGRAGASTGSASSGQERSGSGSRESGGFGNAPESGASSRTGASGSSGGQSGKG